MNQDQSLHRELILIRVLVWGQIIGYLWQALSLAIDDAPEIFLRVNPLSFIWPIIAIAAMYLFHLDLILANLLPKGMLVILGIITCLGTTAAAVLGVLFYQQTPPEMRLAEWDFSIFASWIALAIFTIAFFATAFASYRLLTVDKVSEA